MPDHIPLRPCGVCMTPVPAGDCPRHPRKSVGRADRSGAGAYGGYWRRVRDRALLLSGGRCAYCGRPAATGDHVVPRSKGGRTHPTNTVACCSTCNTSKGDRTLNEWISSGTAPAGAASLRADRLAGGLPT